MKTNVLILALFLFSFSLNSSTNSQDLIVNQSVDIIEIHHHVVTPNGFKHFIELQISVLALPYHLLHGDHRGNCEPPACHGH